MKKIPFDLVKDNNNYVFLTKGFVPSLASKPEIMQWMMLQEMQKQTKLLEKIVKNTPTVQ